MAKKIIYAFSALAAILFAVPAGAGVITNLVGEDYTAPDGSLSTHARFEQVPREGDMLFSVSVDGHYVGLNNDRSHEGGLVHFGSFEFDGSRDVTVEITYAHEIKSFELLPANCGAENISRPAPDKLRFSLRRPDTNITLTVNGNPRKDVLHLFAASVDSLAPEAQGLTGYKRIESRKLIYFAPGYYDLKETTGSYTLRVPDGWNVYVAAGAVLYGRIDATGVGKGTRLGGRGMVYNDFRNAAMLFTVSGSSGMEVEGLTFHGHRKSVWQVGVTQCDGVTFSNVKIISTRYASTDGLDVINSRNCTFRNMFIRSNDDAVAIKGLQNGKPADCLPNRNLLFENMQLWNDCNCAFGMGAETRASAYDSITLRNSCVLYSYDDPDHHEELDERAALAVCSLNGTYFSNILYENIDVYHCERLIALGFKPDFWFGNLKGDQSTPGGISNVTYRNVRSYNSSGSSIANQIHIYGWDAPGTPSKHVRNVTFDNVTIQGKELRSAQDPHMLLGRNVGELRFGKK